MLSMKVWCSVFTVAALSACDASPPIALAVNEGAPVNALTVSLTPTAIDSISPSIEVLTIATMDTKRQATLATVAWELVHQRGAPYLHVSSALAYGTTVPGYTGTPPRALVNG